MIKISVVLIYVLYLYFNLSQEQQCALVILNHFRIIQITIDSVKIPVKHTVTERKYGQITHVSADR
ncbi:MAG: hypothetical protein SLagBPW_41330 [Shewanella algae]